MGPGGRDGSKSNRQAHKFERPRRSPRPLGLLRAARDFAFVRTPTISLYLCGATAVAGIGAVWSHITMPGIVSWQVTPADEPPQELAVRTSIPMIAPYRILLI
jgi:hypothetical protein